MKIINKKNISIILVILVLFFIASTIIGGERETQIPIPKILEGAQVVFDNQMYYQIGVQQAGTKTFKTIGREIVTDKSLDTYYPNRFIYKPVSTSTKFSVIGALNNAQYGLSAIDSGTKGVNYLILQDEQGNKSLIAYLYFYISLSNGYIQDSLNASYYINGQRIDYIRESDLDTTK